MINPRISKYYLSSPSDIKAKFSLFANKYQFNNLRGVEEDLEGLFEHMEHALSQKKLAELSNVSTYIEARMKKEGKYLARSLRFTQAEEDKASLTADIENLEFKYGGLREISKVSRKRYDELTRTYDKLQLLV